MNSQEELVFYLKETGVLKSSYLIEAFLEIDRKDFTPEELKDLAYSDQPLPIGEGQTISQPYTVAFMMELLNPCPGEKILDIGAGSGWTAAILAHAVSQDEGKIFAIERISDLCDLGRKNVSKYNFIKKGIVEWRCKNASAGLPEKSPFDKILVSASLQEEIPPTWKNQLKTGGIIVAPIGNSIWRYTKNKDGQFKKEEFPGFVFVPFVQNKKIPSSKSKFPVVFLSFLLIFLISFSELIFSPPSSFENKIFRIERNQSVKKISRNLAEEKIIKYPLFFKTLVWLKGREKKIQAGKYVFEKPVSLLKVLNIILAGPVTETKKIAFKEGMNFAQMGELFEKEGFFSKSEWLEVVKNPNREGYLFPDTYFFEKDIWPAQAAEKMIENLNSQISEEMKKDIETSGRAFFEILTMASLIEKEAFDSLEERKIISGILWKRLESNIPLQVDAGLTYVTGKPSSKLTEEDLKMDSPYNTYKYRGLPFGPIANPGLESIKAAIYPEKSPYWYYLHDKRGKIHYARNFEEHKRNKVKYLYE